MHSRYAFSAFPAVISLVSLTERITALRPAKNSLETTQNASPHGFDPTRRA